MWWSVERRAEGALVRIGSPLEHAGLAELRDELSRLDGVVVFALSNLSPQRRSPELGVIVGLLRPLRRRGADVRLAAGPELRRLLEITGLARIFPLFADAEQALLAGWGGLLLPARK